MASYDKASQGENTSSLSFHSPLIIPRVPVTFAKIKCGRGSGKDFISLQDSRTRSYEEMFLKNASNDWFRWGKVYDLS